MGSYDESYRCLAVGAATRAVICLTWGRAVGRLSMRQLDRGSVRPFIRCRPPAPLGAGDDPSGQDDASQEGRLHASLVLLLAAPLALMRLTGRPDPGGVLKGELRRCVDTGPWTELLLAKDEAALRGLLLAAAQDAAALLTLYGRTMEALGEALRREGLLDGLKVQQRVVAALHGSGQRVPDAFRSLLVREWEEARRALALLAQGADVDEQRYERACLCAPHLLWRREELLLLAAETDAMPEPDPEGIALSAALQATVEALVDHLQSLLLALLREDRRPRKRGRPRAA
jgi:hypothetical protein